MAPRLARLASGSGKSDAAVAIGKRRGLLANHRHYLYLAEQAMLAEMRKDLIGFAPEPK